MGGRTSALAVCLVLLAGCAGPAPADGEKPRRDARSRGVPVVEAAWVSCDRFVPAPDGMLFGGGWEAVVLPALGGTFRAVAAVICRSDSQPHPGGGSDLVAVEERATDIADLVTALRLPDQSMRDCHGEFWAQYVPWLALLDAQGRWVRPGIPLAPCNAPRAEVSAAIARLPVTRVSTRVLRRNDRDVAKAGGCHDAEPYDEVFGVVHEPDPASLPAATAGMRVCRFRTGSAVLDGYGILQDGGPLPAATWAEVRREIAAAGPAAACDQVGTRFAVLREKSWDRPISVEADGCRRVLIEGSISNRGDLRQGSAELVSLLYG
ncbi:hypothetical protein [Actinoplanes sp. NPDC026619]|uniref:hypothetical protein n=1 Tax=Actinoplanes sp. NPDC026619 TaxID=3155798 RepID=UPI0033FCCF6B